MGRIKGEANVNRAAIAACLLLGLTGCLDETVERREVYVLPDGTGLLHVITAYSSSDTNAVSQKLGELTFPDPSGKLGLQSAVNVVLENHGTQAVVESTAQFHDWGTLAKWIFNGAEQFDPDQDVIVERAGAQLAFNTVVSGLCESNGTACAELDASPYLSAVTGPAIVLDSNADSYDEEGGVLHWSLRTIVTDGIYFRVRLPSTEGEQ